MRHVAKGLLRRSPALLCCSALLGLSGCDSGGTGPQTTDMGDYVVLAWNDLGMHCLNPSYDQLVILPPFNNVFAQVVRRGNPPEVLTSGLTVEYRLKNNTYSYGKGSFGQFWDNAVPLFGNRFGFNSLEHDVGLLGNGLSGTMTRQGDHFVAEGLPVTPIDDDGTWNPYQVGVITVKDQGDVVLVETEVTVPTSDEMHCDKCHGDDAFTDILTKHDEESGTDLLNATPVLCADCHGDPALGINGEGSSGEYLSRAMHGFHADKGAECYDCHPGPTTACSRSIAHTDSDGNCVTCHGTMAEVAASIDGGRVPWAGEPTCVSCHEGVTGVDTGSTLFRNASGHGGLFCAACHGSPHAMIPTTQAADNHQALQYQGFNSVVKTIGSCGMCHNSSRGGGELGEFGEAHGGQNPERHNACHVCHTVVPTTTSQWPHAYTWTNSNQ